MIDDRELDARLAGAAGVSDADLPALPADFLAFVTSDVDPDPASVVALRQLIADAHEARTDLGRRRRPRRRTALRVGAAVLALAAAWATVTLTGPADSAGPGRPGGGTAAPTGGLTLVAAEEIAFPVSLDPAPAGLTPTFSQWGGVPPFEEQPVTYSASYRPAGPDGTGDVLGDGFTLSLYLEDPRASGAVDEWPLEGAEVTTVSVDGDEALLATDGEYADLLWQRQDDQWVRVLGTGPYADADAVAAVGESVVDQPQPLGLQFGLAPAGWTVNSLEESRSIDLSSDVDPEQRLKLSRYVPPPASGLTIDRLVEDLVPAQPVEPVVVQGRPARLVLARPGEEAPPSWYVAGEFPDGSLYLLVAPELLLREQVLQIAEQVSFTA